MQSGDDIFFIYSLSLGCRYLTFYRLKLIQIKITVEFRCGAKSKSTECDVGRIIQSLFIVLQNFVLVGFPVRRTTRIIYL